MLHKVSSNQLVANRQRGSRLLSLAKAYMLQKHSLPRDWAFPILLTTWVTVALAARPYFDVSRYSQNG